MALSIKTVLFQFPQCPTGNAITAFTSLITKHSASEALDLRFKRSSCGTEGPAEKH